MAEETWPLDELPVATLVMITITYFFEGSSMDVDNLPKPIVDALQGLVYLDDEQVTDVLSRKRDLGAELRVLNPSPNLAEAFDRGGEFLHVVVSPAPNQEVIS